MQVAGMANAEIDISFFDQLLKRCILLQLLQQPSEAERPEQPCPNTLTFTTARIGCSADQLERIMYTATSPLSFLLPLPRGSQLHTRSYMKLPTPAGPQLAGTAASNALWKKRDVFPTQLLIRSLLASHPSSTSCTLTYSTSTTALKWSLQSLRWPSKTTAGSLQGYLSSCPLCKRGNTLASTAPLAVDTYVS